MFIKVFDMHADIRVFRERRQIVKEEQMEVISRLGDAFKVIGRGKRSEGIVVGHSAPFLINLAKVFASSLRLQATSEARDGKGRSEGEAEFDREGEGRAVC